MSQSKHEAFPSTRHVRKNGFSLAYGLNYFQIISWTYALIDLTIGYIQISYFNQEQYQVKVFLYIWQSLITIILLFTCFQATYIDPTDKTIYSEHEALKKNMTFVTNLQTYCIVCKAHVQLRTKHCGSCNRYEKIQVYNASCTSLFDHHCVWLNNCIGQYNYKYFFILVVGLVFQKITKMAFNIVHLSQNTDFNIVIISIICMIFDPLLLIILMYLFLMHCYFLFQGLTTYDWIRIRREQQRKKRISKMIVKKDSLTENKGQTNEQSRKMTPSESAQYGVLLSSSKRFDINSMNQQRKLPNEPKTSTIQQWISDEIGERKQSLNNTFQKEGHNIYIQSPPNLEKYQNNLQSIRQPIINENEEDSNGNSDSDSQRKKKNNKYQKQVKGQIQNKKQIDLLVEMEQFRVQAESLEDQINKEKKQLSSNQEEPKVINIEEMDQEEDDPQNDSKKSNSIHAQIPPQTQEVCFEQRNLQILDQKNHDFQIEIIQCQPFIPFI